MTRRKKASDTEITSLTAESAAQYLWPTVRYQACNVLDPGNSIWNAGRFAPASIVLKLTDGPCHVTTIELLTEMSPLRAVVHHEIRGGLTPGTMRVISCIKGPVAHGTWLRVALNSEVQFVEVATIASPSFVAWKRIRVYAAQL